jgi:hypothetical protein
VIREPFIGVGTVRTMGQLQNCVVKDAKRGLHGIHTASLHWLAAYAGTFKTPLQGKENVRT